MKQLTSTQTMLIEKYIDYIDENTRESWEDLYDDLASNYAPFVIKQFTEAMLAANINPLDELVYVPKYYLFESDLPTKLIIPDNIKLIGECAFEYCENLTEITLPKSLTSIKEYAFYGCTTLTTIKYLGTVEDWKYNVYMEDFDGDKQTQFWLCPANKIICSDGFINI